MLLDCHLQGTTSAFVALLVIYCEQLEQLLSLSQSDIITFGQSLFFNLVSQDVLMAASEDKEETFYGVLCS